MNRSTREILAELVAFDTTSRFSNLPLIAWIEEYLSGYGVVSHRVPSPDGAKASLFATIGPQTVGGIGLSGHTDVVPVTGQTWASDPFELSERDGRLYARGACDMKGFLASCLALVPQLSGLSLTAPVHLLFSYDEEVGCTGVRPMIAELGDRLVKPKLVIVGEPTNMTVVDAHKGGTRYNVTVVGREAHSSLPHLGANAIIAAAKLIGEIDRIREEQMQHRNPRFDPEFATVQVGLISGGTAQNIVPNECRFSWEIRPLPGTKADEVYRRFARFAAEECLPRLRETAPEADIIIERVNDVPPFAAQSGSSAVSLALALAGQNETFAVSYGTEAGLFQDAGVPSVVIGPGDIAQAHKPDEFVTIEQLDKCDAFLNRLVAQITA